MTSSSARPPSTHVRWRAASVVGLCLLVSTTLLVTGCRGGPERPPRVILIGMDGATPLLVDPMIAQGKLPTLAALAKEGTSGPLLSLQPLLSPRVWATIATGKKPEKHRILSWVKPVDKDKSELYYSSDRRVHALWNIATEAGLTVGVVNWLTTYPPEIVNGVLVSDHTFADDLASKKFVADWFAGVQGRNLVPIAGGAAGASPVYPETWLARVRSLDRVATPMTRVANPVDVATPLPKNVDPKDLYVYHERDERVARVATEINRDLAPTLMMVLLQGVDRTSHFLYGCTAPPDSYPNTFQPSATERENCLRVLEAYYIYTDALIGRLIADYGPDDLVMVVSDHGFEPIFRDFRLTGNHESEAAVRGIFFARGKGLTGGRRDESLTVTDLAPMILAWLGLPTAKDMDGIAPTFLQVDHKKPIDTYDTRPIERLKSDHSGEEGKLIDALKTLGYVE